MFAFLGTRRAFNDTGTDADGAPVPTKKRDVLEGKRRVEVVFPPGHTLMDAARDLTDPRGVWANHSPDEAPAWVASDSPGLAGLLGEHWGCEVRDPRPEGERGEHAARAHQFTAAEPADVAPSGAGAERTKEG